MQKRSVQSYCPIVTRTSGGFFPKLTAFSKCERAMSTFFVCEWRSFPSCRCVRAWIAGDGWNWNTDWRHWIHCLILGGLDVLKVSAKPKRPVYEASWVPAAIFAAILFLFGHELPRSCQRLREIKRYVVYGNTVCYLKFDKCVIPRVVPFPRDFPSFRDRAQEKLETKNNPIWWNIAVLRRFRAYFGIKGTMNTPSMSLVGFRP